MKGTQNTNESVDRLSREFFSGGRFNWRKSREEVWEELDMRTGSRPRVKTIQMSRRMLSLAAGILILVGIGSFLRYYRVTIAVPAGTHQVAELPGGSKVELNAVSILSYYPFLWRFSRMVKLDGEAHFEVIPGKKFVVVSKKGTTEVLGTRFNIYARNDHYEVTCLSGKVRVISPARNAAVLLPGTRAEIQPDGEIRMEEKTDTFPVISWRDNLFLFTAEPVGEVFDEIERQYNITILSDLKDQTRYTGNFSKEKDVEEILDYICPALGLKFIRKSAGVYLITRVDK